jgi:hypothetical protein
MAFWIGSGCRHPVAVRRSRPFLLVPHFIATVPSRWRHFFAVEYIPPRRRRWTFDDFVLLFRGRYRVTEYRAERVLWFEDRAAAVAWMEWARRK